jgi:hypothetical protein
MQRARIEAMRMIAPREILPGALAWMSVYPPKKLWCMTYPCNNMFDVVTPEICNGATVRDQYGIWTSMSHGIASSM